MVLLGVVGAVAAFLLAAWIGSSIPRGKSPDLDASVPIMVESNGIHTQLVLPVSTRWKDWRETFPGAEQRSDGKQATHIAIGWGDREVFLHNPNWSDLSLGTVARIATVGGPGVLRISRYVDPQLTDRRRALHISPEQYARIAARIEAELPAQNHRRAHPGHLPHETFYHARGVYTLGNTCNQWTSDTLAEAGVRTGLWTPLAGGVMKWLPRDRGYQP